ncbi:MAG: hypothetical protein QM773_11175 [Hyphomonadaceae bacterium]
MRGYLFAAFLSAAGLSAYAQSSSPRLTYDGFGAVRVGMMEAEAIGKEGFIPEPRPLDKDSLREWEGCHYAEFTAKHVYALVVDGRVGSIVIGKNSGVQTDSGISIGDDEARVRKAYAGLRRTPAPYVIEPEHELYFQPGGRNENGFRFSIDADERVSKIYAGNGSIENMEGCS